MQIFVKIIKKLREIAVAFFKESCLKSQVGEDLEWIESQMRHFQSYLEDAEAKQVRTESNFIRDIWHLAYDVDDILDTYFPKMRLSGSCCKRLLDLRNMRITHVFGKEVKSIRRRIENLESNRTNYGIDESNIIGEEDTWNPRKSYPDDPKVVGFHDQIKELEQKVINQDLDHRVVSIIGSAGLGKTTLAREVYNSARESNSIGQRFDSAAWIYVSESRNGKKLLQDLARNLGLDEEKIENDVENNLFKFLETKRYVIVIDNILHTTTWDILMIGIPMKSKNGSRIILTSQDENVGVHVGGQGSLTLLKTLDPVPRGILFDEIIPNDPQQGNIGELTDEQRISIREQILERCGGVPLAIVVVAGLLKTKKRSKSVWEGVLEGMGQDNGDCAKICALSYKDLPLNLKQCFLYFGIFPKDAEVEAFDLINLWAAEEFIKGGTTEVEVLEGVGNDYLNQLIATNLIQVVSRSYNGRVRSVRIHDIMHKICIHEAKDINFFHIHNNECFDSTLEVHRVTVHGNDFNHHPVSYPNTSSLRGVFCFTHQDGQNFMDHKKSKYLRVLRVTGYWNDIPRSVLTSICNLRLLTYLKFQLRTLELPKAISNLENLLTLDLLECRWVYFPNVVWSMEQLRHILLPHHSVPRSAPSVEISLENLQTLHWVPGNVVSAKRLIKLKSLRRLGFKLFSEDIIEVLSGGKPVCQKLEELSLDGINLPYDKKNSLNLSRCDNLSTLHLDYLRLNVFSCDELPSNLTELNLHKADLTTDPMVALKKLVRLKCLRLYFNSYKVKKLVCSGESGDFPELEELKIMDLTQLEKVEIKELGMPSLKKFTFSSHNSEIEVPQRVRKFMCLIRGKQTGSGSSTSSSHGVSIGMAIEQRDQAIEERRQAFHKLEELKSKIRQALD